MNDNIKIQTGKLLFGNWIWEGKENGFNKSIIIGIDEKKVIINWYVADIYRKGKTFSFNANWFGDYLNFIDGQVYYMKSANKKKMVFWGV